MPGHKQLRNFIFVKCFILYSWHRYVLLQYCLSGNAFICIRQNMECFTNKL